MARALDTSSLLTSLATVLWPWIDLVEMAGSDMGPRLRTTAENGAALLRHEVRMTPPIETALMDALHASDALARDLDRASFFQTDARTDALLALNALIVWLQAAHLRAGGEDDEPDPRRSPRVRLLSRRLQFHCADADRSHRPR